MLFRSGDNLFNEAKQFCTDSELIWLYSPFIRVSKLIEIIDDPSKCKAIVVRWQTMDLLVGVSDFEELYSYCLKNKIKLLRNTNIHLKAIRNERNSIFFGSANFTNMGMGQKTFNIELSGKCEVSSLNDIQYLNQILIESHEVTKDYFDLLKNDIDEKKQTFKEIKRIKDKNIQSKIDTKFLLDTLPQSHSPSKLWEIYNSYFNQNEFSKQELECAKSDIITYEISPNNNQEQFLNQLTEGFNNNLFIKALKAELRSKYNSIMGYTQVTEWIANTTLSVPTPSRFDIRDEKWVDRIHNWLPVLDNENFWSEKRHPNGSDLLHFIGKEPITLASFINKMRIDKARGSEAPHQYILLSALYELYKVKENNIEFNKITNSFNKNWGNFNQLFPSKTSNYAMPINAFLNRELISAVFYNKNEKIKDQRNEIELINKIESIVINKELLSLFEVENLSSETIMSYYEG